MREAAELEASGAIPGSVHVPRGMLEFNADPASPYHIADLESRAAHHPLLRVDGGYKAWLGVN